MVDVKVLEDSVFSTSASSFLTRRLFSDVVFVRLHFMDPSPFLCSFSFSPFGRVIQILFKIPSPLSPSYFILFKNTVRISTALDHAFHITRLVAYVLFPLRFSFVSVLVLNAHSSSAKNRTCVSSFQCTNHTSRIPVSLLI